ncbi:MAG: response regulator [Omnitrophica bacterium]|nr:response regulator [Candidatus Omnitrophota bacterium]
MKKKILIVDDEEDFLNTTGPILKNAGYEIIQSSNGKDAANLARKHRPDLILLDINMPGIDGSRTTDILKNDDSTRNIPIIYLSGLLKEAEIEDGHITGSKVGDVHFISKSQTPKKLLEAIKKSIG